jgi:hypothetical protein
MPRPVMRVRRPSFLAMLRLEKRIIWMGMRKAMSPNLTKVDEYTCKLHDNNKYLSELPISTDKHATVLS